MKIISPSSPAKNGSSSATKLICRAQRAPDLPATYPSHLRHVPALVGRCLLPERAGDRGVEGRHQGTGLVRRNQGRDVAGDDQLAPSGRAEPRPRSHAADARRVARRMQRWNWSRWICASPSTPSAKSSARPPRKIARLHLQPVLHREMIAKRQLHCFPILSMPLRFKSSGVIAMRNSTSA